VHALAVSAPHRQRLDFLLAALTLAPEVAPGVDLGRVLAMLILHDLPGYTTGTEFFGDSMSPERHERLVGQTLVGRPGEPDDVAAAVSYLASPAAGYVTGQILQVNGGAALGRG
jgi:NAD(P)-dependent dehydrogenase (short-subunit alcohol dehydrogenase family)